MGIDLIRGGRIKNRGIRQTKTSNTYIKTLIKLYAFLSRRTDSKFNKTIHKRLNQSRLNRYPMSVSRITKTLKRDKLFAQENQAKNIGVISNVKNAITGFFKSNSTK